MTARNPGQAARLVLLRHGESDVLSLPGPPPSEEAVCEAELAGLPDAARRYLRFAGVVGRPYAEFTFSPGDLSCNVAPAALQTGTAQSAAGLGRSRPRRGS